MSTNAPWYRCKVVTVPSQICMDIAHNQNHLMSDDQQLTKGLGVGFLPSLDSKREAHTANKDKSISLASSLSQIIKQRVGLLPYPLYNPSL